MMRRLLAPLLLTLPLAACLDGGAAGKADETGDEPPLETDPATLDRALVCTPFSHPDKPPVLLVHGTFTNGWEQYDWTYLPLLDRRGFDVCAISYPDRGFGDMQTSAEYVVHALRRMHGESGRKVAVIGHSQGVAVPRWAIKWWPSARAAVEDFVLQAGPNHGTDRARDNGLFSSATGLPESFHQMATGSRFMDATNRDDETPGEISYTALYTEYDELVQPVATAMVDADKGNLKVANILLQDVCPGRFVDHATIGLTDRLAFELTLDAIANPGPADLARAGGASLCGLAAIVPDQIVASAAVAAMIGILQKEPDNGFADPHLAHEEPPLKPYAR
ncbi:MAG: alpha/beta fold hydrolase [Gammaproteobacteria bacterium]|nr:alpha/beta fold hydrolase [Gammaproteobacteria bacterium]